MGKELSFEEAKGLLRIDPLNLSEELANHPVNLQRIGERTMVIKADRDSVKFNLQIVEAEISEGIRNNPPANIKITEGTISELVLIDERRQKHLTAYSSLCEEYDQWNALYEAFQSRGWMLRDLVSLAHNVLTAPDNYVSPEYSENQALLARKRRPITTKQEG